MSPIAIKTDLCKKDGLCTMACPEGIFYQREKLTVPEIIHPEECIGCGQCATICPAGAVDHPRYPRERQTEIKQELMPDVDQITELLKSRRSVRSFLDKPVPKDVLEKLLDAVRFSPSARNRQTTEFTVVQDKTLLNKIVGLTVKFQKEETARNPNALPAFARLAREFEAGKDQILHDAPVLLVFHADENGEFAEVNANLALQNALLMVIGLGLASYYAGYVVAVCHREAKIAEALGLPENHRVYGALALGYPKIRFKRRMERNPPKVTWK